MSVIHHDIILCTLQPITIFAYAIYAHAIRRYLLKVLAHAKDSFITQYLLKPTQLLNLFIHYPNVASCTDIVTRATFTILKFSFKDKLTAEIAEKLEISKRTINGIYAKAIKRGFNLKELSQKKIQA